MNNDKEKTNHNPCWWMERAAGAAAAASTLRATHQMEIYPTGRNTLRLVRQAAVYFCGIPAIPFWMCSVLFYSFFSWFWLRCRHAAVAQPKRKTSGFANTAFPLSIWCFYFCLTLTSKWRFDGGSHQKTKAQKRRQPQRVLFITNCIWASLWCQLIAHSIEWKMISRHAWFACLPNFWYLCQKMNIFVSRWETFKLVTSTKLPHTI